VDEYPPNAKLSKKKIATNNLRRNNRTY